MPSRSTRSLTFIVLTAGMTVGFIMTSPDIPVVPMVLALLGVAVLMPIVIYPFTFTIWLAFDLAVHRPEPRNCPRSCCEWHAGSAARSGMLDRTTVRSYTAVVRTTPGAQPVVREPCNTPSVW